jgi:acetolactate synthase II small subunit
MMTQHCLTIRTRNEPVVLERLLQVTRYRGFQLTGMEMHPALESSSLIVTLHISSEKPISLLTNQLNKLYDIQALELHSAQANSSKLHGAPLQSAQPQSLSA